MNDLIKEKCDLLEKNCTILSKKFAFEDGLMCAAAALIFTTQDKEADAEKLDTCRKILKKQTGLFSQLRKTMELAVLSRMSLSDDPERYIADVCVAYAEIVKAGFKDNSYTALAGMIVCDQGSKDIISEITDKAKEIMKRMESAHPVLTSAEDTSYMVLLALSYKDADAVIRDFEEGYDYLVKTYKLHVSKEAVQNLCEVLAMTYGDMRSKCDRAVRIYKAFKKNKTAYGDNREFVTLAALVGTDLSPETLVKEITEAADYLKDKDGFSDRHSGSKNRLMYASILVADACGKDADLTNSPMLSNTVSMITDKRIAGTISLIVNLATEIAPVVLQAAKEKE